MKMVAVAAACLLLCSPGVQAQKKLSDNQIAQILIQQSIQSYPGTCACPYNAARNGSACGRRSAYSRPGGYAPLCYRADVSKKDIDDYRRRISSGKSEKAH